MIRRAFHPRFAQGLLRSAVGCAVFLSLMAGLPQTSCAQSLPLDEEKIGARYPELGLVFNRIFQVSALDSFYKQLWLLKKSRKGTVKVLHIGDSHLHADHLPAPVQKGLQTFFGVGQPALRWPPTLPADSTRSGLVYYARGINGARMQTYLDDTFFWNQLSVYRPDLLIVSLGTNDAQLGTLSDQDLTRQLDEILRRARAMAPGCAVLFTTAADCFRNGYYNRDLRNFNLFLVGYTSARNLPVWDLYSVMNGFGSAANWYRRGWLTGDGVHFTATAYRLQGQLLYNALAKGYNSFISAYQN